MSIKRIFAIAYKEWIHVRRDTRSLILSLFAPLFLLLLFGYALNLDVKEIRLSLVDYDKSASSRLLVEKLTASDFFHLVKVTESRDEADASLVDGSVSAYLVFPPSFEKDYLKGLGPSVQLVIDGSDSMTANVAMGYFSAIFADYSGELSVQSHSRTLHASAVNLVSRIWYNEEMESSRFILTGIVAIILAIISAMVASLTISREIERGTFESLLSTPARPHEIVAGKLVPYLLIGLFDVCIAYMAGHFIFGLPVKGSFILLLFVSGLFIAGTCGLGMMISVTSKVQVLSVQLAIIATYLPSLVLSGFLFPVNNMPSVVEAITYVIPAKYLISSIKSVAIKGLGVEYVAAQMVFLSVYALLVLGGATRKIKSMLPYGVKK